MSERFTLSSFEMLSVPTRTRFPFRYGIASMTEVPHQFLRVTVERAGKSQIGLASEGLPPKWFTKNPTTPFEADLVDMVQVIRHAVQQAEQIARRPISFFDFWKELSREQSLWASRQHLPPLLANLGVSLCERAVIDGLCRSLSQPLHKVIRENHLGLRLGEVYSELRDAHTRDLLPDRPHSRIHIRHTIGLGDPLTGAEIIESERVNDGLPQDLESSIRAYGLRYFKIKLTGKPDRDRDRLAVIHRIVAKETTGHWWATLDGNENFHDFESFERFWTRLLAEPEMREFSQHILAVEQPVHRDYALSDEAGAVLRNWHDKPPLIIDESDGQIGDVSRAIALGYDGASHKTCKGIVKGLTNACLLEKRRREGHKALLTGEDLCTLGPIALLQDLAMMALLGIEHVERNGHHYYRGLSMWPMQWQQAVLDAHPDLYTLYPQGFARLHITDGQILLATVNESPFGLGPVLSGSLG